MAGWNRLDHDLAAILAFVFALALLNQAPWLLAVLGGLAFVGWMLVQLDVFEDGADGAESPEAGPDPLATLQTRYANGEIDETEFERRLERILQSDEIVRGDSARDRGRHASPGNGDAIDRRDGRPSADADDRDFDVETT